MLRTIGLLSAALLAAPPSAEIAWNDVTEKAGLAAPLAGIMGHGGASGDFDGDGRIDLFVGGFCDRPDSEYKPAAGPVSSRLLRNRGDGTFERVSQPGIEFHARTSGAVFADLDNNGTLELYSANNALARSRHPDDLRRNAQLRHSNLFRNDRGTLVDISRESGACPDDLYTARNVGVFDYDADGLLDLLVLEDVFIRNSKTPRSVLLRNKGGLRFEDAGRAAGLPDDVYGLGLAVADLNGDLRPDFFVAHSNRLFASRGDGTYREAVELKELLDWKPVDREDWPCGAAFGDVNLDERLDLVVAGHHDPARLKLFLNEGGLKFREAAKDWGLDTLIPTKVPHVEFQDFDNDGRPDLYTSAAWLEDGRITPLVFRNTGARFEPPRPIREKMVYFPAGPSGDFDGDGRLDLFLINWYQGNHCRLLRNESPARRWLQVRVVGRTVNRMGIGSQVRVTKGGRLLGFQEVATGYGYASGQPAICHFGLGDATAVDLEVTLPNGRKISRSVAADQLVTIEEPGP